MATAARVVYVWPRLIGARRDLQINEIPTVGCVEGTGFSRQSLLCRQMKCSQKIDYSISQSQLAMVLGIGRSHRYGWVNQTRDPNSETAIAIIQSLEEINVDTATEFRRLYLD